MNGVVERNLHDGAQQRLVAIRLLLWRLGMEEGTPVPLKEAIDLAQAEAELAISELRDLARGIHPAALTESVWQRRCVQLPLADLSRRRSRLPSCVYRSPSR